MASAHQCLVIVHISSSRIAFTVALLGADGEEEVIAHRAVQCSWFELDAEGRRQALAEGVLQILGAASLERIFTVFVAVSNAHIRANYATGSLDLGEDVQITQNEVALALARASKQAIGSNREVLHALPQRWAVTTGYEQRVVVDPVGTAGNEVVCDVLLVTADVSVREEIAGLLNDCDIALESMIAEPVALYRGLSGLLPKQGAALIVDLGARHTTLLVHRKGRLVHMEIHAFGSQHLDAVIMEVLGCDIGEAVATKQSIDVAVGPAKGRDLPGQQTLWADIQANNERLSAAASACRDLLAQFFRACRDNLGDAGLLSRRSRLHLVGRGSALTGLHQLLGDIFDMPVHLGSGKKDRDPSAEMADIVTLGLVRMAAMERERLLAERDVVGFREARKRASGLWAWLMTRFS